MRVIKNLMVVALLLPGMIGCDDSTSGNPPPQAVGVGIVSAQRQDDAVVLTIVLKDEVKMQMFHGDQPQSTWWTRAFTPTEVRITSQDGNLSFGGHTTTFGPISDSPNTGRVTLMNDFPQLPPDTREIQIGTYTLDDQTIPVTIKLVPSTDQEKALINQ